MDYDMIQIQIEAEAQKANSSIDSLVRKLNKLSDSLSNIGKNSSTHFSDFGNSIRELSSGLESSPQIHRSFVAMTSSIASLSRSGDKISIVSNSLGELGVSLGSFFTLMSGVDAVSSETTELAKAIATLANAGQRTDVTAKNLVYLGNSLQKVIVTLSQTPKINQDVIQMTSALANLASQGKKVGTASNSIVKGLNRTSTAMRRTRTNTFSIASAFGKFYASYFLVIRGIKGLWTSIESTADYIEAFNYFNVAFGKVASEWSQDWEKYGYDNAQAYADSFTERINETLGKLSGINVKVDADGEGLLTSTNMKNLGLNIQEVTQYASQLASITNSVGQTGETTLAVSDAFTKLAGDISSLFNVDYESVAKNLQSGLIGQSRALYKYGIDITNATLQTYAYAMGIEKSVSEMTQAEKMQLRYIAILDQSKVAFGDLANTINSPSNMIRQLSTNLKEAGMVLGQLFIPFLEKTLPKLNGFSIAIKNVLVDIAGILGIEIDFSEFGQGYDESMNNMDGIRDSLNEVEKSAKKANKAIRSFDELLVIGSSSAVGGDAAESTLDLTKEILDASAEYNRVWNKAFEEMENKAQKFAASTEKYFEPIKDFVRAIKEKDITDLADGLGGLFGVLVDFGTKVTGIDESGISAFSGAVLSMLGAFVTYKTIHTTITKISSAIGLIAAHPYASLAIGIVGVFGALAGWNASEEKRKQIEEFGTTLSELLTVAQEAKDFTSGSDVDFSNMKFGDTEQIKNLADRYFELSQNQNLSKEEMKEMEYLYDTLSDKLPSFKGIIDDETLSYEEQKKAVSGLISELERSYKTKAAENLLTGLYEEQIKTEQALKTALEIQDKYLAEYYSSLPRTGKDMLSVPFKAISAYKNYLQSKKVVEELQESKKLLESEISSIYDSLTGLLAEKTKETQKQGEQLIGLFAGIDPSSPTVKKEIEQIQKEAKETAEEIVNAYYDKILDESKKPKADIIREKLGVLDALDTNDSTVRKEITEIVDGYTGAIIDAMGNITSKAYDIGQEIAKQLKKGMAEENSQVKFNNLEFLRGEVQVKAYATGGFLEDGLFTMNRGEIAGRFNNGSSVVANNQQITDGIANAVYPAVYRAISDAMSNGGRESKTVVQIDGREIASVVKKESDKYFNATGNSMFAF